MKSTAAESLSPQDGFGTISGLFFDYNSILSGKRIASCVIISPQRLT